MAFTFVSSLTQFPSTNPDSSFTFLKPKFNTHKTKFSALSIKSSSSSVNENENPNSKSTKLITFLGKGGSGKTTSAIFAAQTQDPTADYLLNCKIGTSPITCRDNLSAVRLETTKMLLEPLDRLKKADAYLKLTQGVLEGIVGEELGVLPAMDSIFAAFSLERLAGFIRKVEQKNNKLDKLDIVIYDGISSDEILRLVGAASKARLYVKYLRTLAEKTDLGRLAGPSLLRLVDQSMNLSDSGSYVTTSAEIWDTLEKMLERGTSALADPRKFSCFLVMDPTSPASVNSALRYWGCTIQAGTQVSGAIGISSPSLNTETLQDVQKKFSPLPFTCIPSVSKSYPINWNSIIQDNTSQDARTFFSLTTSSSSNIISSVTFDSASKSITLFMPGFDKSEIKLYQYRGGSELLVEAGDQRRVICLPRNIQGKVGGAKFLNRSLVITMR